MGALVKHVVPSLVVAAVVVGGVWSQAGLAQPERPRLPVPKQPAQPTQPAVPAVPPQPGQPGPRPGGPGFPGGPGGPGMRAPNLEQSMKMINRGFRELKAGIGDEAKREENLSAVWMMQQGCASAKRGKPEHLEGDPAEALDGFRRDQIRLMGMLVGLEAAIMDNKTEEAKAQFEEVHEYEEASHEKYHVEKDEDEGAPDVPDGAADRPLPPGR